MYYIYYIPAFDGSMYVGQTKNLQQRLYKHRSDLHKLNDPKYLYFRKLGMNKKDIKLYILKYCDKENVNELELKFIRMFGKLNKVRNDFNKKEYYQKNKEKINKKNKDLMNDVKLPVKTDAGAPSTTPATGTMVFNSNDNKLYIYNGGWRYVDTTAV